MELRQAIGLDNVVIHLDTYHMNIEERSFIGPVAECGDALGCGAAPRPYSTASMPCICASSVDANYRSVHTSLTKTTFPYHATQPVACGCPASLHPADASLAVAARTSSGACCCRA